MNIKACSDFIREGKRRREQGPNHQALGGGAGAHLREQKANFFADRPRYQAQPWGTGKTGGSPKVSFP